MKLPILPCIALAVLLNGFAIYANAQSNVTEMPFLYEKGYVIVKATVKGKYPAEFILAVGQESSVLLVDSPEKYGLTLGYTNDNPQHCKNMECTFTFSDVADIAVGTLSPISLKLRLPENAVIIGKRLGRPVFGILGADFFRKRIVQFDFQKKVIRFFERLPDEIRSVATANQGGLFIKMGYFDDYTTLPIVDDFDYAGKKIKTVLDTGTPQVIILSPQATKLIGEAVPGDKTTPRAGKLNSIDIAGFTMNDVPVLFYGKGMGMDRSMKEFGAVAGVGILQNFLSTFDFKDKAIYLQNH